MTVEPPVVAPVMPYEAIPSTSVALRAALVAQRVIVCRVSQFNGWTGQRRGAAAFSKASSTLIVTFVAADTLPCSQLPLRPT